MQTVKDSVIQERNRLEAAFVALENAVSTALANQQNNQPAQVASAPEVVQDSAPQAISQIQEMVKLHEQKISDLTAEISRLSVDLVKLKDENRQLKEQGKQAADLIGESITVIEKLVAA